MVQEEEKVAGKGSGTKAAALAQPRNCASPILVKSRARTNVDSPQVKAACWHSSKYSPWAV
jgi:hypothetical protein